MVFRRKAHLAARWLFRYFGGYFVGLRKGAGERRSGYINMVYHHVIRKVDANDSNTPYDSIFIFLNIQ